MTIFAISWQIFRFFFYRNVSWVVLYDSFEFCPKLMNLIGCHGNIKGKFSKKYSKTFSSEALRKMKLKLCIHVHDINLYINCVFIVVFHVLSLLWQLKISIDLQWEKWKLAFISFTAVILIKSFTEIFLNWSSTNHMNFVQITDFDSLPW